MISGRAARACVRSAAGRGSGHAVIGWNCRQGLRANRRRKGASSWHQELPGHRLEPHRIGG